jgi:hypothetical protein
VVITSKRLLYLRKEDHVSIALNRLSGLTISTKPGIGVIVIHVENGRDFRLYTALGGVTGMREVFLH